MSKLLKSPNLLQRETPEHLDRRILLAGTLAAARLRRTRRLKWIGSAAGMAAAVAIAVVSVWGLQTPLRGSAARVRVGVAETALSEQELLEFGDWTTLEQESYNITSQLNCYQDAQDIGMSS